MTSRLRLGIIGLCLVFLVIVIAWLSWAHWSSAKIFAECHELQQNTPESQELYSECMMSYGLNPGDWE